MRLPRFLRFSRREWFAIATTALLLIASIVISFWQCDAAWVSRFGALIIIVGVIFAFSDLPEKFEESARAMVKLRTEFTIMSAIDELEEQDHSILTPEQKEIVRNQLTPTKSETAAEVKRSKNRFYAVEVWIICIGTFANGCGQWVLEHLW
jgi:hypothetical protein